MPTHSYAGSTQGIGLGMLKGLAQAGANVVMHGLLPEAEAATRIKELEKQYKVKVGFSDADVTSPQAIRCAAVLHSQRGPVAGWQHQKYPHMLPTINTCSPFASLCHIDPQQL